MAYQPTNPTQTLASSPLGWSPQWQLELEKSLTTEEIEASRKTLTSPQRNLLNKYLELISTGRVPKETIRIVTPTTAKAEAIRQKYEAEKKAAEELNKNKLKETQDVTGTKAEAINQTFNNDLAEIDAKIARAAPIDQPTLYLEKEQLKEELDADLRELAQQNVQDLKDLEAELWLAKDKIKEEETADLAELEQEGPQELARLDIQEMGWTPEKQLAVEEGMTFPEWVDERKKLSADQIEDIEAYTQGLKPIEWTPEFQLEKEGEMTFPQWVEERKKLSGEQIEDIEAYTQGLTEVPQEERKPSEPSPPAPELLITRTNYPKWWNDAGVAPINITAPGSNSLVPINTRSRIFIPTIVITVTGQTVITITFGRAGTSGPIYLGGENQPFAIVIAMADSPAPALNGPVTISATDPNSETPSIGGFITYFLEAIPR